MMIYIFLIQFSGCMSQKVAVSKSDLPVPGKGYYIIHAQHIKYQLENTIISGGSLSGKIILEGPAHFGDKIHVYLSSDSTIKINSDNILSIPLDSIVKVEMKKVEVGKTILLVAGCTIVIILGIGLILFNTEGLDPFSNGI